MSDLKQQLIRLGSANPELQKHIEPVLVSLEARVAEYDHWQSQAQKIVNLMQVLGEDLLFAVGRKKNEEPFKQRQELEKQIKHIIRSLQRNL